MNLKSFIKFLPTYIIIITFLYACSSSSGTIRYGSKLNEQKPPEITSSNSSPDVDNNGIDTSSINDDNISEEQDPSDLPNDENKIDITEILKKIESKPSNSESEPSRSNNRDLILMEIIKYLDTPYKYGGNTLNGIDCSAFTQSVFKNTSLYELNRSAREQYKQGIVIKNRDDLEFGDLVFFNTRRRVKPGHVGIYIGDGLFAHASSKIGVTVSSLDYPYYSKRYMGARRLITNETLR
jgi:cell wall-associated NlpC family hydrolase